MKSPTEKTLRYLRRSGYVCAVTEYWFQPNPKMMGRRKDMFGFVDILALMDGQTLAVQCTSRSNMSTRFRKIVGTAPVKDEKEAKAQDERVAAVREMLAAGWTISVIGWSDDPKPAIRYVTAADLPQPELSL